MNRPIIPTQSDRQKLARLWAWYEAFAKRGSPATTPYDQPAQGQPTPGAGSAHAEPIRFFARITAATQDGANDRWVYDWLQIEKTGAGYDQWGDVEGGYSGTAAASTGAYNLPEDQGSATELATGSRVQIEIVPVWDESAAVESEYWIVGGADGPPNVFPVKVGVDGGDQGTDSAPASYTYTAANIDEDYPAHPDNIRIKIWQQSEIVGDGEPAAAVRMDVLDFNIFASGRFSFAEARPRMTISGDVAAAEEALKKILVVY
jgi:hypothetical protein